MSERNDGEQGPDLVIDLVRIFEGAGNPLAEDFSITLSESLRGLLDGAIAHPEVSWPSAASWMFIPLGRMISVSFRQRIKVVA